MANLARRGPRMNLSGRLNENVSHISGNEFATPATVTANSTGAHGTILLAPGNTSGRSNAAVNFVGRYFQKGLFLPGTFVKYIPSVGLNTPGNIIMGFLDSPDMIRAFSALTTQTAALNFIRDLSSARTAPVWQELTMPLTQAPRRKVFIVDPSIPSDSNDQLDQSVQGAYVWALFGATAPTADTAYGQLMIHAKMRFEEVKSHIAAQ